MNTDAARLGTMPTLGAIFRPQLPPEALRGAVQAAEQAGLREVWLWEDCFLESGIATAAAALAWTDHIVIGIGIIPAPLRNVAITAMEIATLERMFPGRIRIAIGHGVQDWMGQAGVRPASPITLMREYFTALRALLNGQTQTVSGDYVHLTDVTLGWPPAPAPRLFMGGRGPRSLRLCGELADGIILEGDVSPDAIRKARSLLDEGRAQAAHHDSPEVIVYLPAFTGPDAAAHLESHLAAAALPTTAGIGVAGDAQAIAEAVRRCVAAGATTVVLLPSAHEQDIEGYFRFVAGEVAGHIQPH